MNVARAEAVVTAKAELDFAEAARVFPGAELRRFGSVVATRLPALPHHVPYNKARGFRLDDASHLSDIQAFYAEVGLRTSVEVWAGDASEELHGVLLAAGLVPAAPTVTLHRRPGTNVSSSVRIDESDVGYFDILLAGYEVGQGAADVRRMLVIEHATPALRRYLAFVDGHPAGAAALFAHEGVSLFAGAATAPTLRRRGCQTALINRRLADAVPDSDLVVVTAAFGSASHENLTRQGFEITHTRTVWH